MVSFVHLHVHTQYSLLDGASRIPDLISAAKAFNMPAVAITDHGVMYGVIDFYKEAVKQGIKPIIGCELYVAPRSRFEKTTVEGDAYYHLVLLAANQQGYRNLLELVTRANTEGFYYKPRVDKELLREYSEGLICLSGCLAGEIPALLLKGDYVGAEAVANEYREIFGPDNFYLELQDHGLPEQQQVNNLLIRLGKKLGLGLVATNDIHYVKKTDAECHDILLCIQTGKTVDDPNRMRFDTDEFYLKSGEEMAALFAACPEAINNTLKIAERCNVLLEFGQLHLPEFPDIGNFESDKAYLRALCYRHLPERYPEITPAISERLEYELSIIEKMGFSSYFLIVWDFINFARQHHIPVGPGRGSAAGSIVAYVLGITNIDPLKYGLLFERFLNPERVTMPDIDTDICFERREEVINYVVQRYGADRVAQIITFGTMAARAVIRDVGRALNMPYSEVDRIAKLVPNELGITLERALSINNELRALYDSDPQVRKLINLAKGLEGLPRHASTHAAGLVIAKEPLTHYVPLQNSPEGFLTTQYDKDRIEEIGLLKMDLLGLRTLTVIGHTLAMIKENYGLELDIDNIPLDDAKTCANLAAGDTCGVFQMESAGMTALVRDLRPESFADLIPLVALYRPGPLGSGMVTDFIAGRHGQKEVSYLHPLLEPILKETFGVILYQEQVMQIAAVMAGFTLGQADLLRRAMGKKKHDVLAAQRETFLQGAEANGIDRRLASDIFDLMAHFADYGFNKSHSAAYALVAYQTAYLKAHFPKEFMAALLSSVMDTNEKVGFYIEECRRMGIRVLPPDINASQARFTVDKDGIRFGLAAVKNVGENAINNILQARKEGRFTSLVDFCSRVDMRVVNKRVIESLIKCGAFDSTGWRRSQLLAVLDTAIEVAASRQRDLASGQLGLFGEDVMTGGDEIEPPAIDELPQELLLAMEKEMTGFYVTGHPLDRFRGKMARFPTINKVLSGAYTDGQRLRVAGLIVSVKRLNTKKGDTMCFAAVEDFTGQIEVIVFPRLFYEVNKLLVLDAAVVVTGRLSVNDEEIKLLADSINSLEDLQPEVRIKIDDSHADSATFAALQKILMRHHGQAVVYLHLTGRKQVIKTEQQYWVAPSPEFINAVESLLGIGAVQVI